MVAHPPRVDPEVLARGGSHAIRLCHHEEAAIVAACPALDLERGQLDIEARLTPTGRIAAVHDACRTVGPPPGAQEARSLERIRVLVDEEEVVSRDGVAARVDGDLRPARVREVDRAPRELLDGLARPQLLVHLTRIVEADRVPDVEEEAARDGQGLSLAAIGIEVHERVEEVDRERRGANEEVALAVDRDERARRIDLDPPEDIAHRRCGAVEERRIRRRHLHDRR